MRFHQKLAFGLVFALGSSSVSATTPNWQSVLDQLRICVNRQSDDCIRSVAETIVFDLKSAQKVDFNKELVGSAFSPGWMGLVSNLAIHYARTAQTGRAELLYELLEKEHSINTKINAEKTLESIALALLTAHLKAGNGGQFFTYLNAHTYARGAPTTPHDEMNRKMHTIIDTIRSLRTAQTNFDPKKSGQVLAFWLSNEPILLSENIGRHSRHRDAGRLAATLVNYGYADGAAVIANAFPDESVREKIANATIRVEQRNIYLADVVDLLRDGRADAAITKMLKYSEVDVSGDVKVLTSAHLHWTSKRLAQLVWKLHRMNQSELVVPLLRAAGRYAGLLDSTLCRHVFLDRLLGFALAHDADDTLNDLLNLLPVEPAKANTEVRQKCGRARRSRFNNFPMILRVFVQGVREVATIPAPGTPGKPGGIDRLFFHDAQDFMRYTAPLLAEDVVQAFLRRGAVVEAEHSSEPLAVHFRRNAGLATQLGYKQVAYNLVKLSLENDVLTKPSGRKMTMIDRHGKGTTKPYPLFEYAILGTIDVLTGPEAIGHSLEIKARLN